MSIAQTKIKTRLREAKDKPALIISKTLPHVGNLRPADRPLTCTLKPYCDQPRRSSHGTSLPHSCSLQLWTDPRANKGTAQRRKEASQELTAVITGLEGPCKISPRVLRAAGLRPWTLGQCHGPGSVQVGRREASGMQGTAYHSPLKMGRAWSKASALPLAQTSLCDAGAFNRGKLQGQQSTCEN